MAGILALVAFAFVSSVTPGPNNALLLAAGARYGFRATLPHVIGTALGIGVLATIMAAGIGALVLAVPQVALALRVVGSIYLLVLAYKAATGPSGAGSAAGGRTSEGTRPLGLGQAVVFQCVNPKAWIFALAAVSAFRPPGVTVLLGSVFVIATMMLVVVPTAAIWAGGGVLLKRLVANERAYRVVSIILAVALAASVLQLWIGSGGPEALRR